MSSPLEGLATFFLGLSFVVDVYPLYPSICRSAILVFSCLFHVRSCLWFSFFFLPFVKGVRKRPPLLYKVSSRNGRLCTFASSACPVSWVLTLFLSASTRLKKRVCTLYLL